MGHLAAASRGAGTEAGEAAGGGGVGFGCADVVAVDGCWGDEELVQIVEDERGGIVQ